MCLDSGTVRAGRRCGRFSWLPRARTAAAFLGLCLLAGLSRPAAAQTLDTVDLLTENTNLVVRIRFSVRVQYLRSAPLGHADLVQVYFQIYAGDEPSVTPIEEYRKVPTSPGVPGFTVTYPIQTGQVTREVDVTFNSAVDYKARPGPNNRTIDLVIPAASARAAAANDRSQPAAARVVAATERNRYAVNLETLPLSQQDRLRPVPSQFDDYTVFSSQSLLNGVPQLEVNLGYFATEAEAAQVLQQARRVFPQATVVDLAKRRDDTLRQTSVAAAAAAPAAGAAGAAAASSAIATVVAPSPGLPPAAVAAPGTQPQVEKQAAELMGKAREALAAGINDVAVTTLNQLLLLPPNAQSQDAQELIGLAHERAGDGAGARTEYELYLKLFPTGEGAQRVRQRLASLAPFAPATAAAGSAAAGASSAAAAATPAASFGGSIAQYYYGGDSKVQSAFSNVPTLASQQTISTTRQSSLVSSVDLSGRYRGTESDTRVVLRDTQTKGFDETTPSGNRLDAGYVDYRQLPLDLEVRLGRQPGVSGGLPTRFDGGLFALGFAHDLRVSVAAGAPADIVIDKHQIFEGLSLAADNLIGRLGGDVFFYEQKADGVQDRRSAGGELRYFEQGRSLYSLVDYDPSFHALNAATLQGALTAFGDATFTLLFDDRKAPTLATSNALLATPGVTSLRTLLETQTLAQVQQAALAITATARQAVAGVSKPVGDHWQLSADARLSSVGALPQVVLNGITFAAQPGTGNVASYDLLATGSNLYSRRDINSFTLTYLRSPTYSGELLAYNNLTGIMANTLSIGPSLRLYDQRDDQDVRTLRITPGLRVDYRLTPRFSLESEATVELSRARGTVEHDDTTTRFYYVGYRYDLQ